MREGTIRFLSGVLIGFGMMICVGIIGYRLTHPELTETQLFLKVWPAAIPAIFMVGIGAKLRHR